MSKRSLSSWLALPFLVAVSCGGGGKSTTDMGAHTGADLAVAGNTADMSNVAPGADMSAAASSDMAVGSGDMAAPMQGPPAFIVDKTYVASGYYSEPGGKIVDDATCPTRGGAGRGTCHHITYTPAAATGGYAGILWQYPANNWGGAGAPAGFALPAGYTQVQFWAWGKDGGEVLHFSALDSLGNGDKRTTNNITLTTTPTLYTLGVGNLYPATVISAFAWDLGSATHANQFYIDDLVYVAPETTTPAPFNIDANFFASGYIGDGQTPGLLTDTSDCSPTVPGASGCHHFVWNRNLDGGGQGYAGVIWQYPEGNFGGPTDPAGKPIAAGYTEVAFYAWSQTGGEEAAFFAGIGSDTFASKINVILTTTPTLYTLGVGGYGSHVVGGFGWAVGGTPGISLDLDGIQWR